MSLYPPTTTIPVYSVLTGVGIVLTGLRFWVRLSYVREPYPRGALSLDDLFIFIGLIVVITCTGIQFHNAIDGLSGNAISDKDKLHKQAVEHKIGFAMVTIEKIAFGAIKLSLLFFYQRIFGHWPSFVYINYTLMGLVTVWAISFFCADILLCGSHPAIQWGLDQELAGRKCGSIGALLLSFAATSVITDFLVLVLPLLYIRRLQLPLSKKIAASFVFLLGGLSTLAGILRLTFLSVAYRMGRMKWGYKAPPHSKTPLVLQVFNPTFWVMVEMCLGVWAANLPALAPIMKGIKERYKASKFYKKSSHSVEGFYPDGPRVILHEINQPEQDWSPNKRDTEKKVSKGGTLISVRSNV